jgi:hypothetical protein
MSASPPEADIRQHDAHVSFGPISDITHSLDLLVGDDEQRRRECRGLDRKRWFLAS